MTITGQNIPAGIGAITLWYWSSTGVDSNYNDWTWAKIVLVANVQSGQTKSNFNLITDYHKQGTIAHELGHAFGLNDSNTGNGYRVLTQYSSGRIVNSPFPDDLIGINHLYH